MRRRVENTAEGSPRLPLDLPPPTRAAPRSSQDAALAVARPGRERSTQVLLAAYWLVLAACTLLSLGRLLVGGPAFVVARSAALRDALSTPSPNPWVRAILDAPQRRRGGQPARWPLAGLLVCGNPTPGGAVLLADGGVQVCGAPMKTKGSHGRTVCRIPRQLVCVAHRNGPTVCRPRKG